VRVVVISEGPGVEWLRERKVAEGLNNLILLPFQNFKEMPDVLAASDVLMAVLEPEAGIFSVPSKVLTYHCAGKPVLGGIPAENLAARIISQNRIAADLWNRRSGFAPNVPRQRRWVARPDATRSKPLTSKPLPIDSKRPLLKH